MSTLVLVPDLARPGSIAERQRVAGAATPRRILLWPAEQTTLLALQLPQLPAARVRAALVGALEDRLLDDPATLLLALGPQPGATRLVAACARAPLQQWLQADAGQPLDAVVPEVALLEPGEAQLSAHGQQLRLLWREAGGEAGWMLLEPGAAWPLAGFKPVHLLHDAAAAATAAAWAGIGVELQVSSRSDWLARAAGSAWDLRQFELAPQAALHAGLQGLLRLAREPGWRRVGWLLAALLLIQLVGVNAQAWQLRHRRAALQQQLQQLLEGALPGTPLALAPELQMRRALDAERRRAGLPPSDGLDTLLGAAAGLLPPGSGVHGVRYAAGQLELELDPAAAAAARQRCATSAWRCGGNAAQLQVEVP